MDFKHFIWDFDGTLFDTYPHIARTFQICLKKEYLVSENISDIEREMRVSLQHAYDHYTEKYDLDAHFISRFNDMRVLQENANSLPFINSHMTCKFIYQQGLFNYLCTHRDKSAESMLQKYGFRELFTELVTEENGFPRKPAPDGLNYLINKYNMNRAEVLCIGDRALDLESARAAGVKFCLFTEKIGDTVNSEADFAVQNFSDLYYIISSTISAKAARNQGDDFADE
ncbi:MAG: HAD hydrolase-like protein [Oscillospiraceae bacterium]|nr:HAD hydrolase-like protein [Oscillospiraceae bacterium]